jgi:hypothetical protein
MMRSVCLIFGGLCNVAQCKGGTTETEPPPRKLVAPEVARS